MGGYSGSGQTTVSYLAAGDRIANAGTTVPGSKVSDALESLASRVISIPLFAARSTGIAVDGQTYESVPPGGSIYRLSAFGISLAQAANAVFHKDGDSPTYGTVTATGLAANTVVASSVTAETLKFGSADSVKAMVTVDSDNFLVISS